MSTIDITVQGGALPLNDPTLVLRVTLDDGTVVDLSGVTLTPALDAGVSLSAQANVTADPALSLSAATAGNAASAMTADAKLTRNLDAAVDMAAQSTMTADGLFLSNSQIEVGVVRGGLRYGENYTLRVTLDDTTQIDLAGVQLEPQPGAAAVDVVDPDTTEGSIFYQIASGTPATGQQIWHDDSPNTVVAPDGRFTQTVVRDFQAQVWDTDYTWGTLTTIQTLEITPIDASVALSAQSTLTANAELGGELTAGVDMAAQSAVTADPALTRDAATAVAAQSTMIANAETAVGSAANFSAQSTLSADPVLDMKGAVQVGAESQMTAEPALSQEAAVAMASQSTMTAAGEASATLDAGVDIVVQSTASAEAAMDLQVGLSLAAASTYQAAPAMDLLAQATFTALSTSTFDVVGAVQINRGFLSAYSVGIYPALSCYTKVEPK